MKRLFHFGLSTILGLTSATIFAQQAQPPQSGAQAPAQAKAPVPPPVIPPDMDDAAPPIPITKEIVDRLVQDKRARILTPGQIESVKGTVAASRKAASSPYPANMVAEPRSRPIVWRPDVAKKPETIQMWQGMLSTIIFADTHGNAWNVKSVSLDCNLFDDGRSCNGGNGGGTAGAADATNIVTLQAKDPYASGNVVIRLDGLPTPVIFVLKTGVGNAIDMATDVRVEGRNPSAPPQLIAMQSLPAFDNSMGDFLSGIPPKGSIAVKIAGGAAEGWTLNGALYVRTRLPILSPAFTDRVGSAEGIAVYKYPHFVPSLLASVNGTPTSLLITGN